MNPFWFPWFASGNDNKNWGKPLTLITNLSNSNVVSVSIEIKYFRLALFHTKLLPFDCTGRPKKHGTFVTNWILSLLWISIVIPNFKSHNIITSARVYLIKRVKDCKDVSIMSPQDEQWIRTSLLCLYTAIFLFY